MKLPEPSIDICMTKKNLYQFKIKQIVTILFVLDIEKNLGISSEGTIYRLPFENNGKKYSLKRIIPKFHSGQMHYRLNKRRFSEKQIHEFKQKLSTPKKFTIYENFKLQ